MKITDLLLIIALVIISSCKKVEEIIVTNSEKLTGKVWTFESLSGFDEVSNQFAASILIGMTYDFNTDGLYEAIILGQAKNGSWQFNSSMTTITINPGTSGALIWTIVTLTEDELIVTQEDNNAINGLVTWTFR